MRMSIRKIEVPQSSLTRDNIAWYIYIFQLVDSKLLGARKMEQQQHKTINWAHIKYTKHISAHKVSAIVSIIVITHWPANENDKTNLFFILRYVDMFSMRGGGWDIVWLLWFDSNEIIIRHSSKL